ncbi:ankyrin repeat-containing domain protein [Neocallimastix sp. 'constans']
MVDRLINSLNNNNLISKSFLLVKLVTKRDTRDFDGNTSLYIDMQNGHYDIINLLRDKIVDIRNRCKDGTSILYSISIQYINEQLMMKFTLLIAAYNGHYDVVKLGINSRGNEGSTSLFGAVMFGHYNIAKMLKKKNFKGNTPLMIALEYRHIDIVNLLITMSISLKSDLGLP